MRRRQPLPNENQDRDTSTKSTPSTDLETTKMSRFRNNIKPMDIATSLEVASGSASTKSFAMIPTKNYSQRQKVLLGIVCFCFVWALMTGKNNSSSSGRCVRRIPSRPVFGFLQKFDLQHWGNFPPTCTKIFSSRNSVAKSGYRVLLSSPILARVSVIFQNCCFASQTFDPEEFHPVIHCLS